MKKLFITSGLFLILFNGFSQEKPDAEQIDFQRFNVGLGLGIDYGGIGGRFTVLPIKQAFLFAGLGYNIDGFGYNVGAGFRFLTQKRGVPYLIAMYGYNAVMLVFINGEYQKQYNKTFYGASAGFGLEQRQRRDAKNYFNLELLWLFRSQAFKDYKTELENNLGAKFIQLPVSFSIGYHIGF
jgi:hypothetical protein